REDDSPYQHFVKLAHRYQELLCVVEEDWVDQLACARPWINQAVAGELARLYRGAYQIWRESLKWIEIAVGWEGKEYWLVYKRTTNDPAHRKNRYSPPFPLMVHKKLGTVCNVGSPGPRLALSRLENSFRKKSALRKSRGEGP